MALQAMDDGPISPDLGGNWSSERGMYIGGSVSPGTTYYVMRNIKVKPGVYLLKALIPLGGYIRFDDGDTLVEVIVPQMLVTDSQINIAGTGDVLVTLIMDQPYTDPDHFYCSFLLYQVGTVIYTANANDGWMYDTIVHDPIDLDAAQTLDELLPVFGILPNWANGVTERISYLTDILVSETDFEQRRAIRERPRRTLEASFMRAGLQRAYLDQFFTGVGKDDFMAPVWQEQYRVHYAPGMGDTTIEMRYPLGDTPDNHEVQNDTMLLLTDGDPTYHETVIVDGTTGGVEWLFDDETTSYYDVHIKKPIARDWTTNPRAIPLHRAMIVDKPSISNATDSIGSVTVRFDFKEPIDDYPSFSSPWIPRLDWSSAVVTDYDRMTYTVDNESGPVVVTDARKFAAVTTRLTVTTMKMEDSWDLRSMIGGVRGKAYHFLAPTFTSDIQLTFNLTGSFMDTEYTGFSEFMSIQQDARRFIVIFYHDREVQPTYAEIHSPSTYMSGEKKVQRFVLDRPINALMADIRCISFLVPSRFDQDTFEFTHFVDANRVIRSSLVLRSVDSVDLTVPA